METDWLNVGARIVRQQAMTLDASYRPARLVYLLWKGEMLLGVCGTKARAEREALAFGHAYSAVIKIEAREVHS